MELNSFILSASSFLQPDISTEQMDFDIFSPISIWNWAIKLNNTQGGVLFEKCLYIQLCYGTILPWQKVILWLAIMVVYLAKKTPKEISGADICIDRTFYQLWLSYDEM